MRVYVAGATGVIGQAVTAAQPEVIIHQMTALTSMRSFRNFDKEFAVTNELRSRGTDYLLEAAHQAGARRFIAQSFIGWNNIREGSQVKTEQDPLDPHPLAVTAKTMAAILHLEDSVSRKAPEGLVLRYGSLYGHGASDLMIEVVRKRQLPVVGGGKRELGWTPAYPRWRDGFPVWAETFKAGHADAA